MPLYHEEEIIRRVWELKHKHPSWGVRRIGDELGISKDKVYRILRRIEKGDIDVTRDGRVIDRSKPKGVIALLKARRESTLSPSDDRKPPHEQPSTAAKVAETFRSDPFENLLKSAWEIECDKCGKPFKHSFTDEEICSLESNGYAYVDCPTCKDYPLGDIAELFPTNHKVFIRMADVFRTYLLQSRIIKVRES
jgi:hypothetical protein